MTPSIFYILLALSDGERHGYAIMREVSAQSNGQMTMGPGTLYGALKRLLAEGWIEEAGERTDNGLDDERRKYYRLTESGRRMLKREAARLEELMSLASMKRLLARDAQGGMS